MPSRHAFALILTFLIGSMVAAPSSAQDWTAGVFPDRAYDFGTVARGSKVRHSFKVVNTTSQEIHIASWRPKCGCTDVRVGARDIPPGTQTVIETTIDTTKFAGYKASGLVLVLDKPTLTEVDLNLTCFIRTEVTLNPGQADFGVVNRSTGPKLDLLLTYAGGKADWAITEMKTISDHIVAELVPQPRAAGSVLTYQLSVTLKPSAPVGFLKDQVTLKTNDPEMPTIPISVAAVVQSNVTVSPGVFNLGRMKAGESVQKTIFVRSAQPFKILEARPTKGELAVTPATDQSKALHSLTFTFKAPATQGPYNAAIEIETDLKGEPPARITAFATVVP